MARRWPLFLAKLTASPNGAHTTEPKRSTEILGLFAFGKIGRAVPDPARLVNVSSSLSVMSMPSVRFVAVPRPRSAPAWTAPRSRGQCGAEPCPAPATSSVP